MYQSGVCAGPSVRNLTLTELQEKSNCLGGILTFLPVDALPEKLYPLGGTAVRNQMDPDGTNWMEL